MHTLCKMFSNKKVLTINVILIRAILVYSIIQKMGREYNLIIYILYLITYLLFYLKENLNLSFFNCILLKKQTENINDIFE